MKLEPGCYIDASAQSAETLNRRIIRFAVEVAGFMCDEDELRDRSQADDFQEWLNDTADEAVECLNDANETPDTSWTIEDNSLFLVAIEND